jgi:hypothetical protein
LKIDTKIIMDQFISHAGDGLPGDIGMGVLEYGRQAPGRLADNFKVADDGILQVFRSARKLTLPAWVYSIMCSMASLICRR